MKSNIFSIDGNLSPKTPSYIYITRCLFEDRNLATSQELPDIDSRDQMSRQIRYSKSSPIINVKLPFYIRKPVFYIGGSMKH